MYISLCMKGKVCIVISLFNIEKRGSYPKTKSTMGISASDKYMR